MPKNRSTSFHVPAERHRFSVVLLLLACLLPGIAVFAQDEPAVRHSRGVLIRFEGPITPMLEAYFYRKLDAAKAEGADLVVVEIESPGGYINESEAIARKLLAVDWAHTVAFVPQQALSGAAIAALGCDEIVMHPDATFGDAGPIFLGEDALFRHAPEKIRSHLARVVRDLAEQTGRPPALAEAMVDMDLIVYEVENTETGEVAFMSDAEIESADDPAVWKKGKPVLESRKDKFLEVNGRRAVELGMAEANAEGREELRKRFDLADDWVVLEPGAVDTAVYILNLPVITGLLFVVGMVAVYIELSAPGIGLGGLTAVLCFGIFFWSRFLGGTAEWLEVILFALGLVFLLVEMFVLPGFGFAGVMGLTLLLTSLVLAGQTFFLPSTGRELNTLMHTLLVVLGSGVAFVCAAFVLSSYLGELPLLGRLTLRPPGPNEVAVTQNAEAGTEHPLGVRLGDIGTADSPLRPAGKARFGDQYVDVVTDGLLIPKGATVRIVTLRGNRVVVRETATDDE